MSKPFIPPQPAIADRCSDTASLMPVLAQAHMNTMGLAYACGLRGDEATLAVHRMHAQAIRNEIRKAGRATLADTLERSATEILARFALQQAWA